MKDLKISARQTGMMAVMLILANSMLILPSLIHRDVASDAFWVVCLLIFFDLLVLTVFFLLKSRFPEAKFYDILKDHLGMIVAKTIYLLFMLFFLFKSLLTYSVVYMFLKQQVYQNQFEIMALICFLPVVNHAVFNGIRTISRTIEIFFYVVCAGLVLCLAISITNGGGIPLFFQTSPEKFFNSAFKHTFAFGDYLLLFLIMDKIDLKPRQGRKILAFVAIGIGFILLVLFRFYSIYRVTAFMHTNALIDISSVSAEYSAIGRLDVISMLTVMFLTYFQLELFIYGFCSSFIGIFPKLNKIHAIVFYDIVFLILYFGFLGQYDFFIGATESYFPYFMLIINVIVPLTLTFIALKPGKRRKYEKIF